MHLDMQTMSAVSVAVTVVLGLVLLFTWARERESPLVGWWGLALLIQATGVAVSAAASPVTAGTLLPIGAAPIILGCAIKWKAAREFAHRQARLLWVVLGPVGVLAGGPIRLSPILRSSPRRRLHHSRRLRFRRGGGARPLQRRTASVPLAGGRPPGRHRPRLFVVAAAQPRHADQRIAMGGCEHLVPVGYPHHACCCASRWPSS